LTSNAEVQAEAMTYLPMAVLCTLSFMPAFVFDGIMVGTTQNVTMRNGMLVSLVAFLIAALTLQPLFGNWGLWASLHIWFIVRGFIYWRALERKKASFFTPDPAPAAN
jgi:MATE family multidrug resistance protein